MDVKRRLGLVPCGVPGWFWAPRGGRLPGLVSLRRLRTFRASRPNSDVIFAMVFTEARQPCLTSLIQIFGETKAPLEASNSSFTASVGCEPYWFVGWFQSPWPVVPEPVSRAGIRGLHVSAAASSWLVTVPPRHPGGGTHKRLR
ncbi:hypothetical protein JK364_38435 [Streptomyces sp. 110]|uniref:Uncharacterized protein n=1 Tax=Streptomyces endocoffeicus TaxID=2898945 RepID=A0ABS1Q0K2_9ACTN|nr:hypothetical protein [Streptomyces endocoffeicus]